MKWPAIVLTFVALLLFPNNPLFAHCDTMNGPVIKAAVKALETGNVNLVLIWVQKEDEAQIKAAFQNTLTVRILGPEAKKLADMCFFETLVRVHRAGEGVPYTGLKPAETEVEPGIEAADEALEKGSVEELLRHLKEAIQKGIHDQFEAAKARRAFKEDNVAAGREYVKAYVQFIHYVERLYQGAMQTAAGHHDHSPSGAPHDAQ